MKKAFIIMPLCCILLFVLYNCNNTKGHSNDSTNSTEWHITTTKDFKIDSSQSIIKWKREVDNKIVTKKVKMFGSYVDVTMENVQFSSEGEFTVKEGNLVKVNDEWDHGTLSLDFSALKLYSEQSESFFVTTDYPHSTLKIDSIIPDSGEMHYILNSTFSILDSVKNLTIPVKIITDSLNVIHLSGIFHIQTLDWPLKENPQPENVRKDEISIDLNLVFSLQTSKIDSVAIK